MTSVGFAGCYRFPTGPVYDAGVESSARPCDPTIGHKLDGASGLMESSDAYSRSLPCRGDKYFVATCSHQVSWLLDRLAVFGFQLPII